MPRTRFKHRDTDFHGQTGWGNPVMRPEENREEEVKVFEHLVSTDQRFVPYPKFKKRRVNSRRETLAGGVDHVSKVLELIRAEQEFDDGFAFWIPAKMLYGADPRPGPQVVGNCVPSGWAAATCDKVAVEILIEGDDEVPLGDLATDTPIPFIPYSYGAGRVYVGGVYWTSHGSYGSWQIKAAMEHGWVPSDTPGIPGPVPQSTAAVNSKWMRSKATLDQWRPKAVQFDMLDSTVIENVDQLWEAMTVALTPCTIASNWGFRAWSFDTSRNMWIYRKSGSWAHQMHLRAAVESKGDRFFYVGNQWGVDAHKTPAGLGAPPGGFWVEESTMDAWLPNAYCATIGELQGRVGRTAYRLI